VAKVLASKEQLEETKVALACGKELAGSIDLSSEYKIVFEGDDDKVSSVSLFKLGVDKLPDTTDDIDSADDPDNMTDAHCDVKFAKGDDKDCGDDSLAFAKLKDTDYWVRGQQKELEQFGEHYSPDGDHDSSKLDVIEQLANAVSSYDNARVSFADDDDHKARDPLARLMGRGLIKAADEDTLEDLKEATDDLKEEFEDATGTAVGQNGNFRVGEDVEYHVVILAKSESHAEKIKKAYDKYLKEVGKAVKEGKENAEDEEDDDDDDDKKEEKLSKREKKQKKLREKAKEAEAEAMVKALEKVEAEQSGEMVTITLTLENTDEVKKLATEIAEDTLERADAAAEIVEALAEGEDPDKEALKKLGGSELIDAIDAMKMVAEKCKAVCDKCEDGEDKCVDFCQTIYGTAASEGCKDEVSEVLECTEEEGDELKCSEKSGVFLPPGECSDKGKELRECKEEQREEEEDD
jgi:hypothetical protein